MSFTIKYVYHETIAFTIGSDIFYLRQGPGIPLMFDNNLKQMVVPNIDAWFQSKTQQRYSYRGVQHSYTSSDMERVCRMIVRSTKDVIFKTDITRDFSTAYWVELMDPGKLQKFVDVIRQNFERFKEKYDDDGLYNILCRLWQFSNFHAPSEAPIFESLIRSKLGRLPQLPHYPKTDEADDIVKKLVIDLIIGRSLTEFKDISNELVKNVRIIHGKS